MILMPRFKIMIFGVLLPAHSRKKTFQISKTPCIIMKNIWVVSQRQQMFSRIIKLCVRMRWERSKLSESSNQNSIAKFPLLLMLPTLSIVNSNTSNKAPHLLNHKLTCLSWIRILMKSYSTQIFWRDSTPTTISHLLKVILRIIKRLIHRCKSSTWDLYQCLRGWPKCLSTSKKRDSKAQIKSSVISAESKLLRRGLESREDS